MDKSNRIGRARVARLLPAALAVLLSACGVDRGGITDIDPPQTATSSAAVGPAFKSGDRLSVAGTPYDTTDASILVDGLVAGLGSISDGDYVALTGTVGAPAVATTIAVDHPVIGVVSEVLPALGEIRIFGQRVQVNNLTMFGAPYETDGLDAVSIGDELVVSGSRLADGRIRASRIDANANQLPFLVSGQVSGLDAVAGTFDIAGSPVNDPALTLPAGFTGSVRLTGFTLVNGVLDSPQIQQLGFVLLGAGSAVQLFAGGMSGPVSVVFEAPVYEAFEPAGSTLIIGGVTVSVDDQTVVIGATVDQLAVNEYVRVTGLSSDGGGTVSASQIEVIAAAAIAAAHSQFQSAWRIEP